MVAPLVATILWQVDKCLQVFCFPTGPTFETICFNSEEFEHLLRPGSESKDPGWPSLAEEIEDRKRARAQRDREQNQAARGLLKVTRAHPSLASNKRGSVFDQLQVGDVPGYVTYGHSLLLH